MSVLRPVVYDAGMLIAADRAEVRAWRAHRAYLTAGGVPQVPAVVVAQVWRDGARQARLAQLLKGCEVNGLGEAMAREVGELLGAANSSDTVDGVVAVLGVRLGAVVATSDPADIGHLLEQMGSRGKRASLRPV